MKVLLNAVSIKEGGPKVVLSRLLASMRKARPDIEWIIAANARYIPEASGDPAVTWVTAESIDKGPWGVPLWYEFGLPALVRRHRPDVLFSMTNYLPRRKLCPTLLLVQHAGHFSEAFDRATRDDTASQTARWMWGRKSAWVRRSSIAADILTVQTRSLAEAISQETRRPAGEIVTIAHGPGLASLPLGSPPAAAGAPFRIGYITKWGVQKDFQTLFEGARDLMRAGHDFRLVLTLDESIAEVRAAMARARDMGLGDVLENHGEVASAEKIVALYDSLQLFVFPSWCESFGFPMLEAMSRGLPVLVAATPENLEMVAGAGGSFPPRDGQGLAAMAGAIISDKALRESMAANSLARSRAFSWDDAGRRTAELLDRLAV